jgi:hypothetical protein
MPYILRNDAGAVCAVALDGQPGWERIALSNPEIIDFLAECSSTEDLGQLTDLASALSESDMHMERLAEDLLTLLLDKGVVGEDDLPNAVFNNLAHRRKLRRDINVILRRAAEYSRIRAGLTALHE